MRVQTVEIRVSRPDDADVAPLLLALDAYLHQQYPAHEFAHDVTHILSPAELLHPSVSFVAAWRDSVVFGCGAMRCMADDSGTYGEIKRMFVVPEARGQRVGERLLTTLEARARVLGIRRLRLESGTRQPEALRLYERCGYRRRAFFGDYAPHPVSVFMEKQL